MFTMFRVIKDSFKLMFEYFIPSKENSFRTTSALFAVTAIPTLNFFLPKIINKLSNKDADENFSIKDSLVAISLTSLIVATQQAITMYLSISTMKAMKEKNTKLLFDTDVKYLSHCGQEDFSSLQYVTAGVGVRQFTNNAVPVLISLPMYTVASISTIARIGVSISEDSVLPVMVFGVSSAASLYLFGYFTYFYLAKNQQLENSLVSRVNFVEGNKSAVFLTERAPEYEISIMSKNLQEVGANISKISFTFALYFFVINASISISSQFMGGYYKDSNASNINSPEAKILNIMLISMIQNIQNIVLILTSNYSLVKINLEELKGFYSVIDECKILKLTYDKLNITNGGKNLILKNFNLYIQNSSHDLDSRKLILSDINTEFLTNKIYKICAPSGSGKSTFLKSITGNWLYNDGDVIVPKIFADNMCFIPQTSFIAPGSIMQAIIYPTEFSYKTNSVLPTSIQRHYIQQGYNALLGSEIIRDIKSKIIQLLSEVNLYPNVIGYHDLEANNINWNERLSGGEKQKVAVVRALISNPHYIIMDESVSALDVANRNIVYGVIRKYLSSLDKFLLIYTEHGDTKGFADKKIQIIGKNLVEEHHNDIKEGFDFKDKKMQILGQNPVEDFDF